MIKHSILLMMSLVLVAIFSCTTNKETSNLQTLWIAADTVPCVGVGPMHCLQVKYDADADWEYFYGDIDGFDYEEGYEYEVEVQLEELKNPPMDASSVEYTLIKVVEKKAVE